jgi:hypothetical protein
MLITTAGGVHGPVAACTSRICGGPVSRSLTMAARRATVAHIPATLQSALGLDLRRRVVRDHWPYPKRANHCLRQQDSRARPAGEAAWARALEEAEGNGDNPNDRWIDSPCGVHWYEATGIGRREIKIKRYLDATP